MSKTFLFQAIQFTQTIQFSISMLLVLFNPYIGPYQVLPLRPRVDLWAMAMKGYSVFPKTPALDYLVSYPGHSLGGSYPSAEVESVYSTAPVDWAIHRVKCQTVLFQIIQFNVSTQFRHQNIYFEQFSSALVRSSNVKTVLF